MAPIVAGLPGAAAQIGLNGNRADMRHIGDKRRFPVSRVHGIVHAQRVSKPSGIGQRLV